jgi:hypothetical protein
LLWLVRDGLLCEDGLAREKCLLAVVEMGVGGRRNHNRIDVGVTADCSGGDGGISYGGGISMVVVVLVVVVLVVVVMVAAVVVMVV